MWIKTAWRNFLRNKSFSVINIAGLTLGICCVTAIFLHVADDFRYDTYNKNAHDIYRVNSTSHFNGNENRYSTTSTPLAVAIRSDIPGAEQTARMFNRQATLQIVASDSSLIADQKYKEDHFFFADPEALKIFTFTFLAGDQASALSDPSRLIITRKIAQKYFGSVDGAIGKMIQLEGTIPLVVSAVIENIPDQSHLQIDLISHFENYFNVETPEIREYLKRDWLYSPVSTYVLLQPGVQVEELAAKINALNEQYADERVKKNLTYELQPLLDIHLFSDFTFESGQNRIQYVYIFSSIGFLILVIAAINFVNLATVHSLKRSREIGVRKVLGAEQRSLAWQFLLESGLYVGVAGILGIGLLYFILPTINDLSGKQLHINMLAAPWVMAGMLAILILTAIISGTYPAFFISRFNAVAALKGGKNVATNQSLGLRRILVVTQFTASIVLAVFSIIIYQQLRFVNESPLGFQKDFIMTLPIFSDNPNSILGGGVDGALRGRMNVFEEKLLQNSQIEAVTVSSVLPGNSSVRALVKTDIITDQDNVFVPVVAVDYDFLQTYNIQLLAGRNFTRYAGTDHLQAFIINEQAVKLLGWKTAQNAVGKYIEALDKKGTVIGVIKDYHFEGLQQPLRPLLLEVAAGKFTAFSVRLKGGNMTQAIDAVKKSWEEVFPERVFEFRFLDQQLYSSYEKERKFGQLINYFSVIALFISSLGIFGLSAYINHQKQKEASIRKVMGATTYQVFWSLSEEFTWIVLLSILIAVPIGFYVSTSWLNSFAYRIPVGLLPFIVAAVGTGLVVLFTTLHQTLKTAVINPVKALKED